MDEFALCWNNFQDNIASGFQNLFDRGDLVDVTIAVENRLIQAHKIVLAICSPYFQEMFQQNPCKHPISKFNIFYRYHDRKISKGQVHDKPKVAFNI